MVDFHMIPGSDVLSPRSEGLPHSELGEGSNLDELVEVGQITNPLVQVSELRLSTSDHPSHSIQTESGVV